MYVRRARRSVVARVVVVLVLVVAGLGVAATIRTGSDSRGRSAGPCDKAFDRDAWLSQNGTSGGWGKPTPRQRVADTLVACEWLIGATRARVKEVLGKPDAKSLPGEGTSIYYNTGPQRSLPLDTEVLIVTFGRDGRVARVGFGNT